MLRRSNPPIPLGPTTAHLAASTFMLYTLTFRVFLLSVTTSASTALSRLSRPSRKYCQRQTCTRAVFDGTSGISSLLSACATMLSACCLVIFAERGAKSGGHEREDSHGILEMDKRG